MLTIRQQIASYKSTADRLGKQHWWTGCQPVKWRRNKAMNRNV